MSTCVLLSAAKDKIKTMITSFFQTKSSKKSDRLAVSTARIGGSKPKRGRDDKEAASEAVAPGKKSKPSAADSPNGVKTDEDHVKELVEHIHDGDIISDDQENGDISWRTALEKHLSSSSFKRLAKYVATER